MSRKSTNVFIYFFILVTMFLGIFLLTNQVYANETTNHWVTDESGNSYYYVDEQPVTGLQKIDGYQYYFDENGVRQTGVVIINGKGYYFFKSSGKRRISTGLFSDEGKTFYCKSGILQTGWKAINSRAYYFYKTGSRKYSSAKGSKVNYLYVPKKGYLGRSYYYGIKKLNSTKWTLKQAYKNSYKLKYAKRSMRRSCSEDYAVYAFKNKKGNCYCMAATFYIQAKLLGYNVRQIAGKVNKYYPHSWTQIKHGNKWYVYDPNFRNETGRSGWKIYYGKKGTWKYMKYHVFQS